MRRPHFGAAIAFHKEGKMLPVFLEPILIAGDIRQLATEWQTAYGKPLILGVPGDAYLIYNGYVNEVISALWNVRDDKPVVWARLTGVGIATSYWDSVGQAVRDILNGERGKTFRPAPLLLIEPLSEIVTLLDLSEKAYENEWLQQNAEQIYRDALSAVEITPLLEEAFETAWLLNGPAGQSLEREEDEESEDE